MNTSLIWFRRDLRVDDNAALHHALTHSSRVVPVFVFDRDILDALPVDDRRVAFIHACVAELKADLQALGSDLRVLHGPAADSILALAKETGASAVYANEDYEPAAVARDAQVQAGLRAQGAALHLSRDTVIFSPDEVMTTQGRPYTVFTPYRTAWLKRLTPDRYAPWDTRTHADRLAPGPTAPLPCLQDLGFTPIDFSVHNLVPGAAGARKLLARFTNRVIHRYDTARDFPGTPGVSYLSVYNRFGCLSIRTLVAAALQAQASGQPGGGASTWLSELVWREFYFQFLHHHPRVITEPFRTEFIDLPWENDQKLFDAWREARTGYPLVDAAMAQLNSTGYMHNRLRMVSASFLTKDLLVDYRWGEAWFARQLLDFDLSANNGGWQWAASTGCDPQPYFRIFNPSRQSLTFDPDGTFIRKYLPVLAQVPAKYLHEPWKHEAKLREAGVELGRDYPRPVVDHAARRTKALWLFEHAKAEHKAEADQA